MKRDESRRDAKREKDINLIFEQVWCVFDVDEHTRLTEAVNQARDCDINIAISNPSFELWILIHFKDQWRYLTRDDALEAVKDFIPEYDKKVEYLKIQGKLRDAVGRAQTMEQRAISSGSRNGNPSTGMWKLVTTLCANAGATMDEL